MNMALVFAWIMFMLFGFLCSGQPETIPPHVPQQKSSKTAAVQFRKPGSSSQSGNSLAAQFKKRDIHPPMHAVLEKDSWNRAAQFRKQPERHRQQSDDQIQQRTQHPKTPPQQQSPLLKRFSNRTRDDIIFAKLLQQCHGRQRGGSNGRRDRSIKCPQGNQWPQGELWKAWCLQSDSCIPKAVCRNLIKRIGGSDWDVCMDGINVEKGECLVYSVGVAGDSYDTTTPNTSQCAILLTPSNSVGVAGHK